MNKRFCKLGKHAAKAFFLFAMCGATYSCSDDYKFDDGNPSWLGSSIYEYLESQGNYKNFVKLIDDLDYKEVLSRTGSKTLFVADDDAFASFFQDNPWGAHSYSELTLSQKKLILNSAMINNAYLLEMMSSTPAGGGDNDLPVKGECLRRETSSSETDSVPFFKGSELPYSYNESETDYWARFRNDKGIHLALDATPPMMIHFLATQMANKKITDKDFSMITGQERDKNDAYIFGSKVIEQDITCQNGYLNRLDKVLIAPQNLAEVLRTNGETKIFSHMIDRFSAPFYNEQLTNNYRLIYGNAVDSVFQKRYFSLRSQNNDPLLSDRGTDPLGNPNGNTVFNTSSKLPLPFDPGWNTYRADSKTSKEQDMGVIFAPKDSCLMEYFFKDGGGGQFLVKAYAPELASQIKEDTKDFDLVYKALDQIPLQTIRALLNNLMKDSFISSVPSKFETIKNSAQDPMFDTNDDYHRNKIAKTILANNGVVYLMNEVTTPAEYAAVSAPAYVETDKLIFNWAIRSSTLGSIPTNYYAYLLAMSSRFSFFVPCDDTFSYIDPISFYNPLVKNEGATTILEGREYVYSWDEKNNTPKVTSYRYNYDITNHTGERGDIVSTENVDMKTIGGNRLKDMLETHTIIHEDSVNGSSIKETETGVECDKHYFVSKNGAVIYVENAKKQKNGMKVKGGWQIDNGTEALVTGFDDKSAQTNGYGNGFAYMLNTPILPTIESVYSAMYNNPNFTKFFELCQTDVEVLNEIGITSTIEQNKYNIFIEDSKPGLPCFDHTTGQKVSSATNVRFFNNYRYTVWVPTNAAMTEAENKGLPTWQDLRDLLELDIDAEDRSELTQEQEEARNLKAKAMVTAIVNFVKNHFQDNSIFADTPALVSTPYETMTINSETGVYCRLKVASSGNGNLSITDAAGHERHLTSDKNIIVRDYKTDGNQSAIKNALSSSSAAVLHGIDGVLDYKANEGGRYDADWKSLAKARAYLKKYQILN
ncbi:MAG: fasciclin domain-containing protein [Prevotellaceae bacterium]|nr:fasciclin domain-containing protein [Candidatus Minthosoma caballi]